MKYKLSELIATKLSGQWGDDCDDPSNGVPVLTVANMGKNGELFLTDATYRTLTGKKLDNAWIRSGDILIAKSGNPKVCFYNGGNNQYVACNFILTLRANEALVLPKYLYYAITNIYNTPYIKLCYTSTTIPNMRVEQFLDCTINVPTLQQQAHIVAILDKLNSMIFLDNQRLLWYDELVKSRFIELFGDPVDNPKSYLVKSLQELIDMGYITYHLDGNHGGDYPRSEEFVDSGVPYIGANSIVNGEIDFSMAKYLTAERAGKLRKGIAQNEDVLFAHNATVGPTVVLHTTESKVILSTSLTAYRCNKAKLLPNYLKAFMQSEGFVRQYSGEMKQTTRNQVPITAQKKYLFLVPPIVEQEQFATFVEQTDKSKLAVQQSIAELEELKKSLMQKYFG